MFDSLFNFIFMRVVFYVHICHRNESEKSPQTSELYHCMCIKCRAQIWKANFSKTITDFSWIFSYFVLFLTVYKNVQLTFFFIIYKVENLCYFLYIVTLYSSIFIWYLNKTFFYFGNPLPHRVANFTLGTTDLQGDWKFDWKNF